MMIREARRADLDAVVALLADDRLGRERETPGDPGYARAFEAVAASPDNALLVVEVDGEVAGCLQLTILPGLSKRGETRAQIEGVRVAADLRGKGIGAALIGEALARARAAGCGSAQLATHASRKDAQRFYARLGFAPSHVGMKLTL
jgi:ribosomal protein S18 acetylase RimI-like enzyme